MPRTPLAQTSLNHRRMHELSPYERGLVVGAVSAGAVSAGASIAKISEATQLLYSTVSITWSRASFRNEGISKPRSGRPKALSARDERYLIRIARLQPKLSYHELTEQAGIQCHRVTVYRILKEYNLTNWLAKRRPLLTPEVAAKRYNWCWERRDWTYDEWKLFIFSDECSVKRGIDRRRQWVFQTPAQKWDKAIIQHNKKGRNISVMMWAAIHSARRFDLVKLSRDFEAKKMDYSANSYIKILNENLL